MNVKMEKKKSATRFTFFLYKGKSDLLIWIVSKADAIEKLPTTPGVISMHFSPKILLI